ncbi:hypothetical protein EYZ11_011137 [Aspergillus tanneri]|uniref:rRNA-processing protein EFG1 n=1 Tax=Aspergillus tanneri TaxID=1220188 RepID=A0A4S3J912_9EURO|nr:18S rRNA maturation protein [Aspergillus tanneri]KAA8647280.1 18S rRNA maturation protein [Aspergillus tanneri]THC89421.1 hypothetical protein EYZ11_011137 [Aspergillus tanneri]
MPRHYSRSQSPISRPPKDRNYRDRSDARPKRKDRDDDTSTRKKLRMPQKEINYPSVNELKKRIRDVKRLLNRVDLPADARIVQERALTGYEKDLEEEMNRRDRSKMIKKYHFVRFLDRKTATKDVNRLLRHEKEISESADLDATLKKSKLSSLAQKIHTARVNLNYTIYYPLTEKYVALYADVKKGKEKGSNLPARKDNQNNDDDSDNNSSFKALHTTAADKPALWHVVEKCMEDGTLDLLRDGKLTANGGPGDSKQKNATRLSESKHEGAEKKSAQSRTAETKKDRISSRAAAGKKRDTLGKMAYYNNDDDDYQSDGGFFEM